MRSVRRQNFQWATARINSMKSDLTHDEFVPNVPVDRLKPDGAFSRQGRQCLRERAEL